MNRILEARKWDWIKSTSKSDESEHGEILCFDSISCKIGTVTKISNQEMDVRLGWTITSDV